MRYLRTAAVAAAAVALSATTMLASVTGTAVAAGTTVSTTPASYTPYLVSKSSTVWKIAQCGSTMYAVGSFTQVRQPNQPIQNRTDAFSFSATTGTITTWNPAITGSVVQGVAFSADCSVVYLGGKFTSVGATKVTNLAAVSASTGAIVSTFGHSANGQVNTLLMSGGLLYAGGVFSTINGVARTKLAGLDPTTGAVSSYVNLPITGTYAGNFTTQVYNLVPSPDGTRILVNGVFTSIGGQPRQQVAVLDPGATSLTVDGWYAPALSLSCTGSELFYAKGIGWSPDGGSIYIASTGYRGSSPLCDTAAAFSSVALGGQQPLWINITGCDSLYSVVADSANVYVGGHQRYLDNPSACDAAGPGSVSRPGVGDVDPVTGQATAWNPTRSRGHGAYGMTLTSSGLWVASDNFLNATQCGGQYHPGICYFPY